MTPVPSEMAAPCSVAPDAVERGRLVASLARFGAWTLAASAPFYVLGAVFGRIAWFPSNLPWSALAFAVPATVAAVRARREGAHRGLLGTLRPTSCHPGWWVAALGSLAVPTYVGAVVHHGPWTPPTPAATVGLGALYIVAALGEELGWTGYVLPRVLQLTGSASAASLIQASFLIVWHLAPFLQAGHSWTWVAAQSAQVVCMRAVIAGLASRSGNLTWIAVAVHAASNLAWSTSPEGGIYYDPVSVLWLLVPIAAASLLLARDLHAPGVATIESGARQGRHS